MGFMDELKKLTRPYADDDDDFEDDLGLEEEEVKPARDRSAARTAARPLFRTGTSSYDDVLEELDSPRASTAAPRRTESKVVNIHGGSSQSRMVLAKPDRFEQVEEIAKQLRNGHAVVLNLEIANKDVARRIVDFLSGCAYALDGHIKKVAVSTYLITPRGVDIVDEVNDTENSGAYL